MSYSDPDSVLLDTIVGELILLDGRRQADAPHMAVLTPPRRAHIDRRRETLFLFLDLGGGGTGGLARVMVERFTQVYWRHPGTVTSVLREAVGAANAHMLEENRLLPVDQRRQGGIVCAVLRDDNLYLAQIGPVMALLAQGHEIVRMPEQETATLDAEVGARSRRLPLGVSSAVDLRFFHRYLSTGDLLLLTGESWGEGLPKEAENTLCDVLEMADGAEQVLDALERQAGAGAVSALVIECVPHDVSSAVERSHPIEAASQLETRESRREEGRSLSSALSDLLAQRQQFGRWSQRAREWGGHLSDGARTLLTRVLPEPEPVPDQWQGRTRRGQKENVPVMAGIAIAIPLLIAFVVVTFYLQQNVSARREGLLKEAQRAIEVARQAEGEETRFYWVEALEAARKALKVAPEEEQLLAMRDEARARLDLLDSAHRPELIPLGTYEPDGERRLAAGRMQIYVLDVAQQQVTQHTLDRAGQAAERDDPDLVAYRGESVGDKEIGPLHEVVWLEAGGTRISDALLILTKDQRLLQYSPSWGLSWVSFDTGLAHVNVHALRPFDGKLYALDREQSQVWRFPSTADGFGPPEGYFAAAVPDLSNAIDMTIDGAVYVLLAQGRIYKFFGGEAQPFQPSGLPQPLTQPVALDSEGDSTSGALYVADAGAQAIVALTKEGDFIHQIKVEGAALEGLQAMSLDEASRTLYFMAGGRLYALALPLLPEPDGDVD